MKIFDIKREEIFFTDVSVNDNEDLPIKNEIGCGFEVMEADIHGNQDTNCVVPENEFPTEERVSHVNSDICTEDIIVNNFKSLLALGIFMLRSEASKHRVCNSSRKQKSHVVEELWEHYLQFHLQQNDLDGTPDVGMLEDCKAEMEDRASEVDFAECDFEVLEGEQNTCRDHWAETCSTVNDLMVHRNECGQNRKDMRENIKSVLSKEPRECPLCGVKVLDLKQHTRRQHEQNTETIELETKSICNQCGKIFDKRSKLKYHIGTVHTYNESVCKFCSKAFQNPRYLRNHIRLMHSSSEVLFCEECGKRCTNKNQLYHHWNFVHKKVENLNCNLCGKPCSNMAKLRKHTKLCLTKDDSERPYQSTHETNIISSSLPHNLSNTLHIIQKSVAHQSDADSNVSDSFEDPQENVKDNIDEKETLLDYGASAFLSGEPVKSEGYKDNEDGGDLLEVKQEGEDTDEEALNNQSDFIQEYSVNDVPNENQMLSCPLCPAQVKDLKQHTQRQHVKPLTESICEECGKNVKDVKKHMRSVHLSEPRACPECGINVLNLRDHIRRRHELSSEPEVLEPESICNHCGKIFDKRSKLKYHIGTVHTHNESVCDICSKEFKNPRYLRNHIRLVHNSNEQVTCQMCQKIYNSKHKLYHHIKAVHTIEDARCEPCGKNYKNKALLRKHIKLYHPVTNNYSTQQIFSTDLKTQWSLPPPPDNQRQISGTSEHTLDLLSEYIKT